MSNFPTTVQVGPHPYRVEAAQSSMDRARVEMGDSYRTSGRCEEARLLITVDPEVAVSLAREILLHEVFHAVSYTVGLGSDAKRTSEQFITQMTPLLLDTLRRNPALIAFLTETETS